MTVKHIFEGVPGGENYTVSGPDSGKGTGKPLKMRPEGLKTTTWTPTRTLAYRPGIHLARNDDRVS